MNIRCEVFIVLMVFSLIHGQSHKIDTADVQSFGAYMVSAELPIFNRWYKVKPNDSITFSAYVGYNTRMARSEIATGLIFLGSVGLVYALGETFACGDPPHPAKICGNPGFITATVGIDLASVLVFAKGIIDKSYSYNESREEKKLISHYLIGMKANEVQPKHEIQNQ